MSSTFSSASAAARRSSAMFFSERPSFRASFSSSDFPSSIERACSTCLRNARILLRARVVLATASQSRLGWWPAWVTISTWSPFLRSVLSGTRRPLTRAPTHWWPTSVWTA